MLNQERIMLLVTENCNLNCVYCYEHQKNSKVMSFSMAKDILDKQLSKCDPKAPVVIEVFLIPLEMLIHVKVLHQFLLAMAQKNTVTLMRKNLDLLTIILVKIVRGFVCVQTAMLQIFKVQEIFSRLILICVSYINFVFLQVRRFNAIEF